MRAVGILLLVTAVAGCRASRDPVRALIDDIKADAEARAADRIRDRLTDDFQGAGGVDRAEAYGQLRRILAGYESVHLDVSELSTTRADDAADVRLRVDFTGSASRIGGLAALLPPSASYVFDLHVVRRGGDWRLARADWQPVSPSASP